MGHWPRSLKSGLVEVHTGDFQLVRSYLVKQAIARGCSLYRVAVECDGDLGLIDLNVGEVNDVAPYQNRVFAIADQIACVTWGMTWKRHRLNARQDVSPLKVTMRPS